MQKGLYYYLANLHLEICYYKNYKLKIITQIENEIDLTVIEYFYFNFKIGKNTLYSTFDDIENDYYNNDKLFLKIFDDIPKKMDDYLTKLKEIKLYNKKENHTLIIFVIVDLILKIYICNPNNYNNLFLEFSKLESNENSQTDKDSVVQIVYKSKYNLLKKLLSMFEDYFIYYMQVSNKDEYLSKLSNLIINNVYLNIQFKLFIKNMNKFYDLFIEEISLDVRNNIFHYLSNLKEKYDLIEKSNKIF